MTEVAEKLGVSRQAVNAIENGKCGPGIAVALGLARAFDVPVEDVLRIEEVGSARPLTQS